MPRAAHPATTCLLFVMSVLGLVSLLVTATLPIHGDSVPRDSIAVRRGAVSVEAAGAVRVPLALPPLAGGAMARVPADTPRVAPVEYSDWYERRLTIHRVASYATLPLFAFQYVAGRELYDESTDAPGWAREGHGIAATGVAALFVTNTVTGGWNMWDARRDPEGRKWRTAHAVLMLAADAGFTATGLLAETAERDADARARHRNVAIASVAVATTSYLMMLRPFRPE